MSMLLYGGLALLVVGAIAFVASMGMRKKDSAKVAGIIFVSLGALAIIGNFSGISFTTVPSEPTGPTAIVPTTAEAKQINNLTIKIQEAESLDWAAADGTFKAYEKSADLSRDSDKTLTTLTITDGNGVLNSPPILSFTTYRGGIDGSTTYYDQDWGEWYLKAPTTVTTDTVSVLVRIPDGSSQGIVASKTPTAGLQKVGTIDDILNEAKHDSTYGDTNYSLNDTNELRVRATDTMDINKTATGTNGQVKMRTTLGCGGSNTVCRNYTFGFDQNTDALIEGDEFSSLTSQLYTGTDLGLKSDLLTAWKNNQGVVLGNLKGGIQGTYDLTFGLNTANITAGSDSFKMCADDLGTASNPVNQKDTWLGTKATKDCSTINFSV